jgi:hypothetical protein
MKPHRTEVYIAIENICRDKRHNNIIPAHALRLELGNELRKYPSIEIDRVLDELEAQGRIERGRTINDTWIKTK